MVKPHFEAGFCMAMDVNLKFYYPNVYIKTNI